MGQHILLCMDECIPSTQALRWLYSFVLQPSDTLTVLSVFVVGDSASSPTSPTQRHAAPAVSLSGNTQSTPLQNRLSSLINIVRSDYGHLKSVPVHLRVVPLKMPSASPSVISANPFGSSEADVHHDESVHIAKLICEKAAQLGISYIVMGTQGSSYRPGAPLAGFGAVATYVSSHATVPVITSTMPAH